MRHLNVEIKARCDDLATIRSVLKACDADFKGEDHQIDTYFRVPDGRLKLREGTIERSLIYYRRPDQAGPKSSTVVRYTPKPDPGLKEVLAAALGVWVVVDKRREIYFIDNVKFHLDRVDGLGSFVEIEAIGEKAGETELRAQCEHYLALFDVPEEALIEGSYSDLIEAYEEA